MKLNRFITKLNKTLRERQNNNLQNLWIEESAPITQKTWNSIQTPSALIMKFLQKKIDFIESENKAYGVQGQDQCPICKQVVNYRWTWFEGFTEFNCLNKCLSLPKTYIIREKEYNG